MCVFFTYQPPSNGSSSTDCSQPFHMSTAYVYNFVLQKKNVNAKTHSPLKYFGQQTNSTPENNEIPQGKSIAKLRNCIPRS